MTDLLHGVTWFRQSSVRIRKGGVEIHVDPWGVTEQSIADFILLTHPHYDSFLEEDIEKLRGPQTVVVAPSSMRKQVGDVDHFLRPGDLVQLDRIDILAVPAHNREGRFHPMGSGWLGYVFSLGDLTYYHTGHTDYLGSMRGISCDVAFVACCSDYTMGPEEALQVGEACGAAILVPIHWSDRAGHPEEVRDMAEQHPEKIRILERQG
jgi:L-ascorbate metabolism protein UlaG (beta-lactamase superfamily)